MFSSQSPAKIKSEGAAPFLNPLCIALDVDTKEEVVALVDELSSVAGGFKLGPRLIHRYGRDIVDVVAKSAPVFVDCKFFDIPSTMISAVRATFDAGASVCTVHAMSGPQALKELAQLEAELSEIRPFRIIAVTILTSWDELSFSSVYKPQPIADHVLQLAKVVKASGLRSVVCSPQEIALLAPENLFLLTPGIRQPSDERGDQKRVMSPREALMAGSSCLVVGRPIIGAKSPLSAAQSFMAGL